MTRGQRVGMLALAAIVAAAAFVILRPQGEGPVTAERQPVAQGDQDGETRSASQRRKPEVAPSYTTIRLRDGRPVGGVKEISLDSGDTARLEIRSDRPAELHIHGYDRYVDVQPGESARTRFRADLEGVFEVEDHDTAVTVAELKVSP